MPRLPLPLQAALREAVAARFGQPLRYPSHCDALELELQQNAATAGRRLSPSTLRRFFGLVDKDGGYHLHTLDTLARYAGHADFAAFGQSVSGMALQQSAAPQNATTDIPELLAMEQLAYPERLLLGYFLGRITRPAQPGGPAAPLALQLATHPAGQEFYVESFVDLAHLTGAFGEVLATYLQHKHTPEAQLFGHAALFLAEFLAQDEPAWRQRLAVVRALPVPPEVHAFPRGRRAFAEIVTAWHEAPNGVVPAELLTQIRQEAATVPRTVVPQAPLPAFYNLFPAGYHFFVAEALFLTGQFPALLDWLAFTNREFPDLAWLETNVFDQLMRAFQAVAELRTGLISARAPHLHLLFNLETNSWLLDYFQVHIWLVELHFAAGTDAAEETRLRSHIKEFTALHRMPFFERVAEEIGAA
ncbi:hypothetical protein Q5H92_11285 [Hymenobacter sp. M29]|uniref:Knr4/Smi1-like domain-containing protein n=1 Tax=Hymenobacter mellowenesis TaxID=3063995 RepID=A0ABT9AAS3_9BACT|nr:hypothetical protein [Hymenobacter sp. M29]MDO7846943.1 hypothetical protein [Hymenobacter sp. M29]